MFVLKFAGDFAGITQRMGSRRLHYYYGVAMAVCTVWTLVYIILSGTLLSFEENGIRGTATREAADSHPAREKQKNIDNDSVCEESTNIAFIKVHKASGGIVANILQRFGDRRNLTFVLPKERNTDSAGWPYCFHTDHMLPSSSGRYNILCNHAVYNRRELVKILPKDTHYVTILRNPEHHFEALFNHYRFAKVLGIHAKDSLREFLSRPDEYVSLVASNAKERFLLHNPMAYDLGFDPEYFTDEDAIMKLIGDIEKNFRLVMISDYLEESLVLMRRQMCWSLDDVIYYKPTDAKIHSEHRAELTNHLRSKLRNWNFADHALYQHFNKTFWKRIRAQGDGFFQEVEHLRARNRQIYDFCRMEKNGGSNVREIDTDPKVLTLPFDKTICKKLDISVPEYTKILRSKPNQYLKWEL